MYQKEGKCIIYTIYLYSIRKRGNYSKHNVGVWSSTLYIRKRETVSYLQCVYNLDIVYQKEENGIILTVCLVSKLCVSERRNLYHSNMIGTFWQRKIKSNCIPIWVVEMEEIVSYLGDGFCLYKTHFIFPDIMLKHFYNWMKTKSLKIVTVNK